MRAKGFDVRSGELEQLRLPEATFDVVSVVEVVEHISDVGGLLTASRALLRPGGSLYITTPHGRGAPRREPHRAPAGRAPPRPGTGPGHRVESGYRLNEALTSSLGGTILKGAANAALNATRLGDTLRLVAERRG